LIKRGYWFLLKNIFYLEERVAVTDAGIALSNYSCVQEPQRTKLLSLRQDEKTKK
jgi:hypothetical protein